MLEAVNLKKKYSNLEVLKGVSFSIQQGEFVTIVGPSGAGKSTLLHLLGALDKPDEGSITIAQQNIATLSSKALASFRNNQFGFIFQFHHLLPEFTALENVMIPVLINGRSKNEAKAIATEVLQSVGLAHRMEHKPNALSGGEQQRVAIARAIVNKPSIIFADEPTGNLDSTNATSIHELFKSLQQSLNITFVVVTHNESLALLGNKTFHMRDGNIEKIQTNE